MITAETTAVSRLHRRRTRADTVTSATFSMRFWLQPEPTDASQVTELIAFCRENRIAEVNLLMNVEEWWDGPSELGDAYDEVLAAVVPALKEARLVVDLNPWATVGQRDSGRTFKPGQDFTPMTSPTGERAKAQASFACPVWQEYIAKLYAHLARHGFDTIWFEDDFRYHNHPPLSWGGDFSDAVLFRFGKKIRRKVSRDDLVDALRKPGPPHPWRKAWLELWAELQEEVAGKIARAVRDANPQTRLGLMSSAPWMHAQEGRNWHKLFRAMKTGRMPRHRPHFASYSESIPRAVSHAYAMLDVQKRFRPAGVESNPEIENYPYTAFNKSQTTTWANLAVAQLLGCEALSLNLTPRQNVAGDDWLRSLLQRCRPSLDWLAQRFPPATETRGLGVIWSERNAWRTELPLDHSLFAVHASHDLVERSTQAATWLHALGVAARVHESDANVLWGRVPWTLAEDEIARLFSKPLWLDAEATAILVQRKLLDLGPDFVARRFTNEESVFSWEEFSWEDARHRASVAWHQHCTRFGNVEGFEEQSIILDQHRNRWGPAHLLGRSPHGAPLLITAYNMMRENGPCALPLSVERQGFLHGLIRRWLGNVPHPLMVTRAAHVLPVSLSTPEPWFGVWNLCYDAQQPWLHLAPHSRVSEAWTIAPLGPPRPVEWESREESGRLLLRPKRNLHCHELLLVS